MKTIRRNLLLLAIAWAAASCATASAGEIVDAVQVGDVAKVKQLLAAKPEQVNERDGNGKTPLLIAVSGGKKELVELLLTYNADVNAADNNSFRPLDCLQPNDFEIAALLRSHGAVHWDLPIFEAIENRDFARVRELLVNEPALVKARERDDLTALELAAIKGDLDMAKLLVACKADANAKDNRGGTPLRWAVRWNNLPLVELLIANNADVNIRDNDGSTPLHAATGVGSKTLIQILLAHKADVEAKSYRAGVTPLMLAAMTGKKVSAEELLANKADVNAKSLIGRTALHCAASCGFTEVAEVLLANKADVNAKDNKGRTPLDCAEECKFNDTEKVIAFLRAHGGKSGKELGKE